MDLKKYIRSIPDYPKKGILFRDITTLIKDPKAFKFSIDKIIEIAKSLKFDKVSAIESRDFKLEYGEATIEVHKDSISKNENILVIDDLIATGGTAEAAAKLIEVSGGKVAGFIFIINLFDLPGEKLLKEKSYFTKSLMEFPGH
jgi:adenine phosphoribosyltransferase